VTGEALATGIQKGSEKPVRYARSFANAIASVAALAKPGDMILTLGAGSVSQLGQQILQALQGHESSAKN